MADLLLKILVDFTVLDGMLPSLEWAVEFGVLSENEAYRAASDVLVDTVAVVLEK